MIDVGSEWRSFSNDKNSADPSRVGGPENPLLDGCDLSTIVGPSTSGPAYGMAGAGMPADGASVYRNRRTVGLQCCLALVILHTIISCYGNFRQLLKLLESHP